MSTDSPARLDNALQPLPGNLAELIRQAFPICDALRHELSWTHYRTLLKVASSYDLKGLVLDKLSDALDEKQKLNCAEGRVVF